MLKKPKVDTCIFMKLDFYLKNLHMTYLLACDYTIKIISKNKLIENKID